MVSTSLIFQLKASPATPNCLISSRRNFYKFGYPARIVSEHKFPFKLGGQSLGDGWKLNDINTSLVQEKLNLWLLKTQNFLNDVTSPIVKSGLSKLPDPGNGLEFQDIEEIFMAEQTIDSRTPNGSLSLAAIVSIEQFSRMNGLTGKKMLQIFKALVPESVYSDGRHLVEYCCFRFLSRNSSDFHPALKEPAFQRLIFITMLAWENPYSEELYGRPEKTFFKSKLVREEAFVRIAPAISGLADRSTAYNLFKALAGNEEGISLSLWLTYVNELLKVHEGRRSYQIREFPQLSEERVMCIGSDRKRPVLKWENNLAWPGKLTLTDKAIYFEAVGLLGEKQTIRLDLTRDGSQVEKAKVGPLGSALFDSAVSVSSGTESKTWVLEFVDLGGEMRRDVWHAFISEVIALHKFMRGYGPEDGDESIFHVYGAHKGNERARTSAANSIARLHALQFMRKLLDDPTKLVQFSYLQTAPYGDVVFQTLAVNYWGGPLVTRYMETHNQPAEKTGPSTEVSESSNHVFDIDGSVYLQKWMRSPSWASSASITFWRNSPLKQGVTLSKNHVVAGVSLVERAAVICNQKYQVVEKTQATIDAATLTGIPSNIDLFKELLCPFAISARNFEKLRRWEEPHLTVSFLALAYTIIFRNLLSYIFPMMLMILAAGMLTIKGLKEQGRLGRSFGHPQITTEVALVLLSSATTILIVPFKYIISFLLFDLFTRELEFRREMVKKFINLVKERWHSVPAAPVVVLPFESEGSRSETDLKEKKEKGKSERKQSSSNSQ
ncbi:DUF639 family protein [Quillaja saponaria]|uniref:DUF639 family protein n=1 Tax=Quillaja saponaria TaxID=32244 RepID=A0AAD7M178_QUISA|nr:DUF639 family protein [Quillaja saponaria]